MRRKVTLELGELIELILDKTCQMRAQNGGFVGRGPWLVIANDRIFTQAGAE